MEVEGLGGSRRPEWGVGVERIKPLNFHFLSLPLFGFKSVLSSHFD